MAIPSEVQKKIAEANAVHEAVYGKPAEGNPAEPVAEPAADATPVAEATPAEQAPVAEAAPVETAPAPEEKTPKPENWEHKFKTLQGMYTSSQTRHQTEIRELREQLSAMNLMVVDLKSQANRPKDEGSKTEKRLVRDEEIADYGADMIDVIKRAAREDVQADIDRLAQENAQLREQLTAVSSNFTLSAKDRMYSRLDAAVPDWRVLNADAGFLEWLQQIDPYAGQQRHAMLKTASDAFDAERVIAFFKGYIDQTAAVIPPRGDPGVPRPQVSLESLVAPGRPKSTTGQSAQTSNGKHVWSSADIRKFYADVQRGVFRHREPERLRLEEDIVAAGREGRIR